MMAGEFIWPARMVTVSPLDWNCLCKAPPVPVRRQEQGDTGFMSFPSSVLGVLLVSAAVSSMIVTMTKNMSFLSSLWAGLSRVEAIPAASCEGGFAGLARAFDRYPSRVAGPGLCNGAFSWSAIDPSLHFYDHSNEQIDQAIISLAGGVAYHFDPGYCLQQFYVHPGRFSWTR